MKFELSGVPLKDRFGDDFMIVALPPDYVPSDKERKEWWEFFHHHFEFPVILAYWKGKTDWILAGLPRLVRELEGQDINALPWQRISVESSRMPPISYDRLPPLDET